MEKQRKIKIITIIALIVSIVGLSIGFAAFTNVLTISSTATVTPDESAFSVLFSSSGTSQLENAISPTVSGATGDNASISGTTISGLKANFTEPGQTVTYTFWAHNAGSYIAYLRSITYGKATGASVFKSCTPGTDTTESLAEAACEDISVSVSVGSTNVSDTKTVTDHSLVKGAYEQVVVTISYASNGDRADGDFSVTFGDVTLNYSSVDTEEIKFKVGTTTYTALDGMTWAEWIESDYNTNGSWLSGSDVMVSDCIVSVANPTDVILPSTSYTYSVTGCIA